MEKEKKYKHQVPVAFKYWTITKIGKYKTEISQVVSLKHNTRFKSKVAPYKPFSSFIEGK